MANERPWWADHLPDTRGLATVGIFALAAYGLYLVSAHPELQHNELFETICTLLFGTGGLGLACAFLWGGSKATTGAVDAVNAMARASIPAPGATVTTVSASTVKSEALEDIAQK